MSWLSKLFSSSEPAAPGEPLLVDMHSHLLPGLDDGSKHEDESMELIRNFSNMGYKKLIMTPHIMGDFFKNTPATILPALERLRVLVKEENIDIELNAAAEYYMDEWFIDKLNNNEPLLTFGDNYLLVETSYMNEPNGLNEALFLIKSNGYKPVLAHPERYIYLYSDFKRFQEIYAKGILFQINLNSLAGYYSKAAQKFAERLVDENMVDMVGSDCHGMRHVEALQKVRAGKYYQKLLTKKLLNNSLL
jgi:protein-tyrosine phosphatase